MIDHSSFIGKKYGNLEVIAIGPTNKNRKKLLEVKCLKHIDFPSFYVVKQSLINGSTKGCHKCFVESKTTHGKHHTRVYHSYKRILQRLKNPKDKDYPDYGGRGIDMNPRYDPEHENQGLTKAFLNFYEDIGDYNDPLTLDRMDNSKGYWKDNLRLVSMTEQARNKRSNVVTKELVEKIRKDYNTGLFRQVDLCLKYQLGDGAMSSIINKKCWKEI